MNVKIGSLQMFMVLCGSCEDMGPCAFPVDEVNKISVLDIRLANADRHAGNILVHKNTEDGQVRLFPIDHGYCLPENVTSWFIKILKMVKFGLFQLIMVTACRKILKTAPLTGCTGPQARQPYSSGIVAYIKLLDAEKDIELLKFYGWELSFQCARVLRISTMSLKKGAERGLSPFAIGSIICRETLKKESVIEQIIREAREAAVPGFGDAAFLESVSLIIDGFLDRLPESSS